MIDVETALTITLWFGLPTFILGWATGRTTKAAEHRQEIATLKARIAPFDHDGDGMPGGSRKRPSGALATSGH